MVKLTVLVPVFRESAWLRSSFAETWAWLHDLSASDWGPLEVRFCLWSTEAHDSCADAALIQDFLNGLPAAVSAKLFVGGSASSAPSVVASLLLALGNGADPIRSSHTMICPIDCEPTPAGAAELLRWLAAAGPKSWAVFAKRYDKDSQSASLLMALSAFLQNQVFSRCFGWHCWTHLFVVPSPLLGDVLCRTGFLEDLDLNKKVTVLLGRPHRMRVRARVSSRRYVQRGVMAQFTINVRIFLAYLVTGAPHKQLVANLRQRYEKASGSNHPLGP